MVKSVLVHTCCVHCSLYTLEFWKDQGYAVSAFWYNPNIHPKTEHDLRYASIQAIFEQEGINFYASPSYEPERYFQSVSGQEDRRCNYCFGLRLAETAREAIRRRMDAFTTSLLISPHQKHDELLGIGDEIAANSGIIFLYSDLRRRFSEARALTKNRDLYRQHYCGCLYSLAETERNVKNGL